MTTQQVWANYANDIKQFIISKVKDTTIADDILQDVFIKIHTKIHLLNEPSKVKSWCFTIAKNAIIDYWKTANKTFEVVNSESENEIVNTQHTKKDCLQSIINNLPRKYKIPLFLSDIKGLKQQEVAQQLNQSLPTTKSQIQRARKLITQGFIDCCGFVLNNAGKLIGEIQEKENCKVCR